LGPLTPGSSRSCSRRPSHTQWTEKLSNLHGDAQQSEEGQKKIEGYHVGKDAIEFCQKHFGMLLVFSGSWPKNGSIEENCGLYNSSTEENLTFALTFVILYKVVFGTILSVLHLHLPTSLLEFLKILLFFDRQLPCQIAPQGGREQPPGGEDTPHRPRPNPPLRRRVGHPDLPARPAGSAPAGSARGRLASRAEGP